MFKRLKIIQAADGTTIFKNVKERGVSIGFSIDLLYSDC